jgi:hypothetical protein
VAAVSKCLIEGCDREEETKAGRPNGGLCAGHRWRKKAIAMGHYKGRLEDPISDAKAGRLSKMQLFLAAVHRYADASSESIDDLEYRRALKALHKARRRLCGHHTPPAPGKRRL